MRETILSLLKAKFGGVSDKILGRMADKLAKTAADEEQAKTLVEGTTLQQLLESYGDSRATEAQQTAVRNYESKYGLKDGAKVGDPGKNTDPTKKEPDGGDGPAWAQQLIKSNEALTQRIQTMETTRTAEERRQKISKELEGLPESVRKAYERTPVADATDEEFNTLLGEIKVEAAGIAKDLAGKGAVFGKPAVGGDPGGKDELTKEQVAAIDRRDGAVSGEQQPF